MTIGCVSAPPSPLLKLGCPDKSTSIPTLSGAVCEPTTSSPALSPLPVAATESQPDDPPVARGFVLIFRLGSSISILWLLMGSWVSVRLLSRTIEAPQDLKSRFRTVTGTLRAIPGLRIGAEVAQPFVIGLFRPTIVLPERFQDEPDDRIEAALKHEWAHIRHGDLALLALLRALLPLLFAHPAYWWLRRRVRADQEAMADARAVRDTDRLIYAEALLTWARSAPPRAARSCSGSLALGNRPGELRERVALLLNPPFPVETRCPLRWRLGAFSTAVALIVSLASLSVAISQAGTTSETYDCSNCNKQAPTPTVSVLACPSEDVTPVKPWSFSAG
ncbi:MAG TPA: M56 family metallopeptidase [Isosphaeraceae bacterium]|nr:M56 family metallopeptidase [Isosphaeraceae bacterium]